MSTEADIVERLGDFDNHGLTAAERFKMRMDAHQEIKALRAGKEAACLSIGSMQPRLMAAESEVAILRAERDAAARDMRERCAQVADGFIEIVDRQRRPLREKIIAEKLVWDITAAIRALPSTLIATEETGQ